MLKLRSVAKSGSRVLLVLGILGLAVTIAHKPDGGEVRIRYKTLEQLDDVCRRLRFG